MKQFYVLVLFCFSIVLTGTFACLTADNEPEPQVRFSLEEVPGGVLRVTTSKVINLGGLMREAYLPEDARYPLKQSCLLRPQVYYLYALKVEGNSKVPAEEILAELDRKNLKPINICELVALTKNHRLQMENVVALDSYSFSVEMCARAYINRDSEKNEMKLSRKQCPDEFSGNAIFAVTPR